METVAGGWRPCGSHRKVYWCYKTQDWFVTGSLAAQLDRLCQIHNIESTSNPARFWTVLPISWCFCTVKCCEVLFTFISHLHLCQKRMSISPYLAVFMSAVFCRKLYCQLPMFTNKLLHKLSTVTSSTFGSCMFAANTRHVLRGIRGVIAMIAATGNLPSTVLLAVFVSRFDQPFSWELAAYWSSQYYANSIPLILLAGVCVSRVWIRELLNSRALFSGRVS